MVTPTVPQSASLLPCPDADLRPALHPCLSPAYHGFTPPDRLASNRRTARGPVRAGSSPPLTGEAHHAGAFGIDAGLEDLALARPHLDDPSGCPRRRVRRGVSTQGPALGAQRIRHLRPGPVRALGLADFVFGPDPRPQKRVLPSRFWHKWLTESMMRLFFASPVAIQTPKFLLTNGRFRTS